MRTQNKIYGISIIFIIIIFILIVFFVYPYLRDIKNSSKEILSDKNNELSINMQNIELDSFKKKYNDYKTNLEKINQLFIDPLNPIDFIKFLEKISFESGINSEISILPAVKEGEPDNSPSFISQISARGNFLNILQFSEKLESGPYLARIQHLIIKKSEEKDSDTKNRYKEVKADFLIEALTNKQ